MLWTEKALIANTSPLNTKFYNNKPNTFVRQTTASGFAFEKTVPDVVEFPDIHCSGVNREKQVSKEFRIITNF